MPARFLRLLVAVAALALATLSGWYYMMGTPQYSLHRFAGAIQGRDASAAERFIDVDRVAQAASDVVVAQYLAGRSKAAPATEEPGQGTMRTVAGQAIKALVAARVRAEIRKTAAVGGSRPGGFALPAGIVAAFWGLEVARDGRDVWVTYVEPRGGRTRFRMSQLPDRSWTITEIDREWILRQLKGGPAG